MYVCMYVVNKNIGVSVAGMAQFLEAGVILDWTLTFDEHCNKCAYYTCALRHMLPLLTTDAAKMIAFTIVGARLDYCNSLLYVRLAVRTSSRKFRTSWLVTMWTADIIIFTTVNFRTRQSHVSTVFLFVCFFNCSICFF